MRIAIFGAAGRTGRPLVEQALNAGHDVTAFVRDASQLAVQQSEHAVGGSSPAPEASRLRIVEGDVHDSVAVDNAVKDQDAVLVVLGHTKSSTKDVLTKGTENIIAAMQQHGVKRLVSLTGAGVRDPRDQPKLFDRLMGFLLKRMAADLLADSERQANLIKQSGLDWTIVRVPMLNDGSHSGKIRVGYAGQGVGARIARADVAEFMLSQITDTTYMHKAPMISN